MAITVCLSATNTVGYPAGGGHLWVYLNWALGLRALGCRVIWLEVVGSRSPAERVREQAAVLEARLATYGLANCLALCSNSAESLPRTMVQGYLDLDAAAEADLLLNLRYGLGPEVVGRFRRSAMIDIDPGLLQIWMSKGQMRVARHDLYFTIGETVGRSEALFPDCGLRWHFTPPCVALDWWLPHRAANDAPFTTVSHWYAGEWVDGPDGFYHNDKRSGFLPYFDLPRYTTAPLELALCLGPNESEEEAVLRQKGWRVRHAYTVASAPSDYQRYIQGSRGEFSCVKPSCIRLQNAWISDRTLCYLASGKPAIVQHTGPSRFLPDDEGLLRFRTLDEAVRALAAAEADYERHCAKARALAEEHFDARKVVRRVLECALP